MRKPPTAKAPSACTPRTPACTSSTSTCPTVRARSPCNTLTRKNSMSTYKLSPFSRILFGAVLVAVPATTVTGLLLVTDDSIVPYQNSALVSQYATAERAETTQTEPMEFSSDCGKPGGTETLVLHETGRATGRKVEQG